MPTFENPATDADEVRAAVRALAHATRSVEDPRQIYSILGSLSSAVAAMSQSLHQLADVHDHPPTRSRWAPDMTSGGRSAAYSVSWDLRRAAEMLKHVGSTIDHAHEAEAKIVYHPRESLDSTQTAARSSQRGLSL